MANEHLRTAIRDAGLTVEEFADIVAVDPKTVQRWISGRTPYARHRATISRALDRPEHQLWPDTINPPATTAPPSAESGAALPGRAPGLIAVALEGGTPAPPDPAELIGAATTDVFLADPSGDLFARPDILTAVASLVARGASTRVIFPGPELAEPPALDPGVEMRTLTDWMPLYAIVRADDHLLLRLDLVDDLASPWLHLHRPDVPDAFDRLAKHCDFVWDNASEFDPDDYDPADYLDDDDDDQPITEPPHTDGLTGPAELPASDAPAPPRRRWPGRNP